MVFLFGFVGLLSSLAAFFNNSSFVSGALAFSALAAILVYGGLLMLYLPFYYSVAASLSLQTLILLSKQANGSLPVTALHTALPHGNSSHNGWPQWERTGFSSREVVLITSPIKDDELREYFSSSKHFGVSVLAANFANDNCRSPCARFDALEL